MNEIRIRPIDPNSEDEIDRAAQWMRATLIEVEGEETGITLYSLDWLRQRVRWHLDPACSLAAVLLAEETDGSIVGHSIVRRETDETGGRFGLISTTYVVPSARRRRIGERLLWRGEEWFQSQSLQRSATWTSANNTKLINLYEKNGYQQTATHIHETTGSVMVKLEKSL